VRILQAITPPAEAVSCVPAGLVAKGAVRLCVAVRLRGWLQACKCTRLQAVWLSAYAHL
jgi:hypothetical protein